MALPADSSLSNTQNVSDVRTATQINFELIWESLAFNMKPSLVAGVPTTDAGPPTSGTFAVGNLWVDSLCAIFRCSVAGTPGTWVQEKPARVAAEPVDPAPTGYLIQLTTDWSQEYWDGAAWQPV